MPFATKSPLLDDLDVRVERLRRIRSHLFHSIEIVRAESRPTSDRQTGTEYGAWKLPTIYIAGARRDRTESIAWDGQVVPCEEVEQFAWWLGLDRYHRYREPSPARDALQLLPKSQVGKETDD
jgi:hypothetical protein